MVTAIDFTGSNLDPQLEDSLHNLNNQPNPYQKVLRSLWDVIENYDTDKWIPSYGFGAKPHFPTLNEETVNHCFPLTGS